MYKFSDFEPTPRAAKRKLERASKSKVIDCYVPSCKIPYPNMAKFSNKLLEEHIPMYYSSKTSTADTLYPRYSRDFDTDSTQNTDEERDYDERITSTIRSYLLSKSLYERKHSDGTLDSSEHRRTVRQRRSKLVQTHSDTACSGTQTRTHELVTVETQTDLESAVAELPLRRTCFMMCDWFWKIIRHFLWSVYEQPFPAKWSLVNLPFPKQAEMYVKSPPLMLPISQIIGAKTV